MADSNKITEEQEANELEIQRMLQEDKEKYEISLIAFTEMANGTVLSNGEESVNKQPLSIFINKFMEKVMVIGTSEEITKSIQNLDKIMSNEDVITQNPSLVNELNPTLKKVFDIPKASLGLDVPDSSTIQEVLIKNPDISSSLFSKMIDTMVTSDENENPIVDIDIVSALYLHKKDLDSNEIGTFLHSNTLNAQLENEEIKEKLEKGSSSVLALDVIDKMHEPVKKHVTVVANDAFKEKRGQSEEKIEQNKKELEQVNRNITILDRFKSVQEDQEELESSEKLDLTDEVSKENYEAEEKLKKELQATANSYTEFSSLYKLNKEFKKVQDQKVKERLEVEAKVAEETKLGQKNAFTDGFASYENERNKLFKSSNIKKVSYLESIYGKKKIPGSDANVLGQTYIIVDEYGNARGTMASKNVFTGIVNVHMPTQENLQAVFSDLRSGFDHSKGRFSLHLHHSGDPSLGAKYISDSISAALTMTPPIDLDDIVVPKQHQGVMNQFRENQGLVSTGPIPERRTNKTPDPDSLEQEDMVRTKQGDKNEAAKVDYDESETTETNSPVKPEIEPSDLPFENTNEALDDNAPDIQFGSADPLNNEEVEPVIEIENNSKLKIKADLDENSLMKVLALSSTLNPPLNPENINIDTKNEKLSKILEDFKKNGSENFNIDNSKPLLDDNMSISFSDIESERQFNKNLEDFGFNLDNLSTNAKYKQDEDVVKVVKKTSKLSNPMS